MLAPLEDPTYEPLHPPVNGKPPDVVAKWGPRSQLRWFRRFWDELYVFKFGRKWDCSVSSEDSWRFHIHSVEHVGPCCGSCIEDEKYLGYPPFDDHCCCRGYQAAKEAA